MNPFILSRNQLICQELFWYQTDTLENYKEQNNLYSKDRINYKFNDYGFRCDNFDQDSSFPVVFFGCSCTEGIGLPLEETWSHRLYSKIKNYLSIEFPYWNLAMGGTGLDAQSSLMHWITSNHKIKYIFGLIPPITRREYFYKTEHLQYWSPSYSKNSPKEIQKLFSDENFYLHRTMRDLILLDASCRINDSTCYFTTWDIGIQEIELSLLNSFSNLNFFENSIISNTYARDSIHFGKEYHSILSTIFWNKIKEIL